MVKKLNFKRVTAISACSIMLAATALGGFATLPGHAAGSYSNEYSVDLTKTLQEFDGWGLSLSWWATEIGSWERIGSSGMTKREEIMEALYGESGLNLNIARYNIGGGDDPSHTHMTDDRNTPGWRGATKNENGSYSPNTYYYYQDVNGYDVDWRNTPDYRQLWVLDWIQDVHGTEGDDDLITEFYSNSPPYWMTIAGCSSGGEGAGQNLENDNEHNQAFVEYFLDVYEYLVRQGFTFDNLQPFNESGSKYWGTNGDQEGAYFSAQQKVEVLSLLIEEMERRGIDVPYNWGDETNTDVAVSEYNAAIGYNARNGMSGRDVVSGASRFTYHLYGNDSVDKQQRLYRTAKSLGQELYMSEITWTNGDDYDPEDMATGFHYVKSIVDSVKGAGVDAFVFWQGMEDMLGQMKGHTNYGLIQGVYTTPEEAAAQGIDISALGLNYQDFVLAKSYYLSGQYTKYIRPGYTIIDVDDSNGIVAASPDGSTLVYVKRNEGSDATSFKLNLGDFKAKSVERVVTNKTENWSKSYISTNGSSIIDVVDGSSVTTYIIKGENTKGNGHLLEQAASQYKNNFDQIEAALAENGDVEQLYSTFTGADTGEDNGGFMSGKNRYCGKDSYIAFRFYGTGYGLSFVQKNDSGKISVWVDKATTETPDATKELYSATRIDKAIVVRDNTLEEDWHTVIIKCEASNGHKWFNFYGAFIYTSPDKEVSNRSLTITEAAGLGGTVKFGYEATGYDDYELYAEYRTGATEWIKGESALSGGEGSIGVGSAKSVRLRLVAEKNGAESEYSAEQVVSVLETTEGVLYYADAGTADPSTLATGAVLGVNQSVSDQPYGADPYTGLAWGYTGTTKSGQSGLGYYETYEAMTSMMSLEKVNKIEYKFTIPVAGTYRVTLGFFGGSTDWGERSIEATVSAGSESGNGTNFTLHGGDYTALYFTVTTESPNDEIVVSVTNSSGNAQLSAIVITNESAAIPLYTSATSNYNTVGAAEDVFVGADLNANAEAKDFTVYYSDSGSHTAAIDKTNAEIIIDAGTIEAGTEARATFIPNSEELKGIEPFALYNWKGAGEFYYNIDMGFVDNTKTPPDDEAGLIGTKQSTTRDREFGQDGNTSWGYVGTHFGSGVEWKNDNMNKWSIREGMDGSDGRTLIYKMTGFLPNEYLRIGVSGHCGSWTPRTIYVECNDVRVGEFKEVGGGADPIEVTYTGEGVQADAKGELTVSFKTGTSGQGVQISYLKVWSASGEVAPTITADKTTVGREDTVTLRNLVTGATVYVLDENGILFDSFKAESNTKAYNVEKLPASSYELHFLQAVEGGATLSEELIVDVPGVDITQEVDYVRNGSATAILFTPHAVNGVTALSVTTPGGVTIDVSDGFFYRAMANGTYTVTIVSGGVSQTEEFVVNNVDTMSFGESISETGWTTGSVTVTLNPTAASDVVSVEIFKGETSVPVTPGSYQFVAEENGEYRVVVKTGAGFTYEKIIAIDNIDTSDPELELEVDISVSANAGLSISYEATSASGGKLYVSYNDGEAVEVADPSTLYLEAAGKYVIHFVSGTGKSTSAVTYYVTYGTEGAQLATVTVAEDGTVSASGATSAKLYRAGEGNEITSKKADKAGRYYLVLEKDGETEIVVISIAAEAAEEEPGPGPTGGTTTPTAPKKDNSAIMIAGIVIGCAAIIAAAGVCVILVMKGRKE